MPLGRFGELIAKRFGFDPRETQLQFRERRSQVMGGRSDHAVSFVQVAPNLFAHAVEGVGGAPQLPGTLFGEGGALLRRRAEGFRGAAEPIDRFGHALEQVNERNEKNDGFQKHKEALRPDHQAVVRFDGKENREPRAVLECNRRFHGRRVKRKKGVGLFAAHEHFG